MTEPLDKPRTLGALFEAAGLALPAGADPGLVFDDFVEDSRAAGPGALFLAVRGEAGDGHRFIPQALEAGARLVLAEHVPEGADAARVLRIDDTRAARGPLAQAWWGAPSRRVPVAGVTGTNGKTTVAYLLESALRVAGLRPALFGTVEYRFEQMREDAPTTTPGALHLARFLSRAVESGARSAVMEVSSHALAQGRVDAMRFDVALMTNLTQDHLDYHRTMEEYAEAKRLLFTRGRPRAAVFNADDPTAAAFARAHEGERTTFSLDPTGDADLIAETLTLEADRIRMRVRRAADGLAFDVDSPLRGRFNASNLLGAAAAGLAMRLPLDALVEGLQTMRGAPGRFEAVLEGQPFAVYVDYAHTPDAVERILENVRGVTKGRVHVVIGCGGDRDPGKRPKMGAVAGRLADFTVLTNDNPRTEAPEPIAAAVEEGVRATAASGAWTVVLDRRLAIRTALEAARPGDSVVIAGKGHETYQEVHGVRTHFDDREVAREILREMMNAQGETPKGIPTR